MSENLKAKTLKKVPWKPKMGERYYFPRVDADIKSKAVVDDFDWERDMARLASLPRQAEWEAYVSQFQGCDPNATSAEKWQMMDKIFDSEK